MARCVFNGEPLQTPATESVIGNSVYSEAQQVIATDCVFCDAGAGGSEKRRVLHLSRKHPIVRGNNCLFISDLGEEYQSAVWRTTCKMPTWVG